MVYYVAFLHHSKPIHHVMKPGKIKPGGKEIQKDKRRAGKRGKLRVPYTVLAHSEDGPGLLGVLSSKRTSDNTLWCHSTRLY